MPYVTAEVLVDLSDFDDQDLIDYLEANGYVCTKEGSSSYAESIAGKDLDRIDHLFVCGQNRLQSPRFLALLAGPLAGK